MEEEGNFEVSQREEGQLGVEVLAAFSILRVAMYSLVHYLTLTYNRLLLRPQRLKKH